MKTFKYLTIIFQLFIFLSCFTDIPIDIEEKEFEAPLPFTYEIIRESRQVVLTQEYPWEELAILYFNVLKNDSIWEMWYNGYGITEKIDYFGNMCYATSNDGLNWDRKLTVKYKNDENLLSNIIHFLNDMQIIEQFISYDYKEKIYRMIGSVNENGKITTNLLESENGTNWVNKKILFDKYYDTQFSVIEKGDKYYIYQRIWHNGLRSVGRSVLDRNYNIIEFPKAMLMSNDKNFPHIYNNATSVVKELTILFPTLFNKDTDRFKLTIGFEYDDELYLTDFDITNDLFYNENVKWGIVSPGLIPTDEPDTYWIYYYGASHSHETLRITPGNISKYYRIKIRIVHR